MAAFNGGNTALDLATVDDESTLYLGSDNTTGLEPHAGTYAALYLWLSKSKNYNLVLADAQWSSILSTFTQPSAGVNPTLIIYSALNPQAAGNKMYLQISHDQTRVNFFAGTGGYRFQDGTTNNTTLATLDTSGNLTLGGAQLTLTNVFGVTIFPNAQLGARILRIQAISGDSYLVTEIGVQTLLNKTISGGTFTGTIAGSPTLSGVLAFTNATPITLTNSQTLTLSVTAQTGGAATLTIPDFVGVSDTLIFSTLAQTLAGKTLTGTFAGTPTFSGNVVFSGTPSFSVSTFTMTNAQTVTIQLAAQTVGGGQILSIPNFAQAADTFAFITLAQTLSNKTLSGPTLSGTVAGSSTFSGTTTFSNASPITLSAAATLTVVANTAAALLLSDGSNTLLRLDSRSAAGSNGRFFLYLAPVAQTSTSFHSYGMAIEATTLTYSNTTTDSDIDGWFEVKQLTISQSGGAKTVNMYAGILTYTPTCTASITLTSGSAFYAANGAAATGNLINTYGFYVEGLTRGANNYGVFFSAAMTGYEVASAAGVNLRLNALTTGAVILYSGGTEFFRANNTGVAFFAGTPAARQTSGANLTNNVIASGTTDQLDDFTSLTVYATDAAAIHADIYQLGRKVKQINDALRLYNLLT